MAIKDFHSTRKASSFRGIWHFALINGHHSLLQASILILFDQNRAVTVICRLLIRITFMQIQIQIINLIRIRILLFTKVKLICPPLVYRPSTPLL
jgi:hypothetical protein